MLVWEYDQEAEFKAIRSDGIEQGIEQGIKQVTQNMLAQGATLEVISNYTGLPINIIKKMR